MDDDVSECQAEGESDSKPDSRTTDVAVYPLATLT